MPTNRTKIDIVSRLNLTYYSGICLKECVLAGALFYGNYFTCIGCAFYKCGKSQDGGMRGGGGGSGRCF